jgi:hypothetical protein
VSTVPAPSRSEFIAGLVTLGEEILAAKEQHLQNFVTDFVEQPNRFRWELLGKTALDRKQLSPQELRQLDVLGLEPDLLTPLHRLRRELSHTRALSWALAPGHRWLGYAPLQAFLQRLDLLRTTPGDEEDLVELWSRDELAHASVQAEHYLGAGGVRADISIDLPRAFILVEVKIDAQERLDQIGDYRTVAAAQVEGTTKVPLVVFLTANPDIEPSRPTPHLTFEQLLRDWLPVATTMDTHEHRYLRAYLASVARVVDVGAAGSFDDWDFARRRRAIDFIKTRDIE